MVKFFFWGPLGEKIWREYIIVMGAENGHGDKKENSHGHTDSLIGNTKWLNKAQKRFHG